MIINLARGPTDPSRPTTQHFCRWSTFVIRLMRLVGPTQLRKRQSGHAMIEWLIVCLPIIWLGALLVEVTEWHTTRQRLALATQRATTLASLEGGQTTKVMSALIMHLPKDMAGALDVCVTDPVSDLMRDFKDQRLSQQLGFNAIRHDHVPEQHRQFVAKGWPAGQGPWSRRDISEANRLNVKVSLQRKPRSPWVGMMLPAIKIQTTHQAVMQSHRRENTKACLEQTVP